MPDTSVPINPTKMDIDPTSTKVIPMAGQMSPIGEQLLMKGTKKGKGMHITTIDWGLGHVANTKS
jgi:hypothetical protein